MAAKKRRRNGRKRQKKVAGIPVSLDDETSLAESLGLSLSTFREINKTRNGDRIIGAALRAKIRGEY